MHAQTFHHNGHNLSYYTVGKPNNPPIILIHGYTSSHVVWRQTISALKNDYYCIAIDLLGHGNSDVPSHADYSIVAQGERVLALADYLDVNQFSLIGHSMGGQTSMTIASTLAPDRVDKVINVSGVAAATLTPFYEDYIFVNIRRVHGTVLEPLLESLYRFFANNSKIAARFQFGQWFYDVDTMMQRFEDWRIDRIYANRVGIRHVWWHCMNAIHNHNLTEQLSKIKAETRIIFGAQDGVVPVSDGYLADKHIPNSDLVLIDACGHFPMHEATEQYLDAVRQFLIAS